MPLVVVAIALLGVGWALVAGMDMRVVVDSLMATIREAGPWVFFAAMMVLPAMGMPLALFTIPAGEAFAPQLGMGGVIAISLAVIAVNLALAYAIARYALRPLLTAIIRHYGYSIPSVTRDTALGVTLVVRLTPGPPYALQNFILAAAEVPFRLFLVVSWLAVAPWAIGGIVLGRGIFAGNFKIVIIGVGVLVVAIVAVRWVRKKYSRRES